MDGKLTLGHYGLVKALAAGLLDNGYTFIGVVTHSHHYIIDIMVSQCHDAVEIGNSDTDDSLAADFLAQREGLTA